jgi:hypothetical protein
MTKKLIVVIAIMLSVLLVATPAMAAGPRQGSQHCHQGGNQQKTEHRGAEGQGQQLFALVGTITGKTASSITISVIKSNKPAKPYIGDTATVEVTGSTRYLRWTEDGGEPISFDALSIGDAASANGRIVDGVLIATRVTIDAPCVLP